MARYPSPSRRWNAKRDVPNRRKHLKSLGNGFTFGPEFQYGIKQPSRADKYIEAATEYSQASEKMEAYYMGMSDELSQQAHALAGTAGQTAILNIIDKHTAEGIPTQDPLIEIGYDEAGERPDYRGWTLIAEAIGDRTAYNIHRANGFIDLYQELITYKVEPDMPVDFAIELVASYGDGYETAIGLLLAEVVQSVYETYSSIKEEEVRLFAKMQVHEAIARMTIGMNVEWGADYQVGKTRRKPFESDADKRDRENKEKWRRRLKTFNKIRKFIPGI